MGKYIITVDGPAASGKGTVSRKLAELLNFYYLDTGIFFRLLAKKVLQKNLEVKNSPDIQSLVKTLDLFDHQSDKTLRSEEIANISSVIAQYKGVRESITALIRSAPKNLPKNIQGIVIDGRDIGSVVFPQASCKFYIAAEVEERAKRRWKELQAKGKLCTLGDTLQELIKRDDRDANRVVSPLKVPKGAFKIDTTSINPDEVVNRMLEIVRNEVFK